ncbi:5-methyltetrahydropteroyltriglutamate--homocysteine S-methyltransferase [Corynebacterium sp. 3HC-13]|nr:5-methyltetrahydropteroyltriglutamate--homocysteine S-methyltransferase [Corynebacterium poyangense]
MKGPSLTMSTTTFPTASILGYPRIGEHRELKFALEKFWKSSPEDRDSYAAELHNTADALSKKRNDTLSSLGLDQEASIPEDFCYYDQILDLVCALGATPDRFAAERDILAHHSPESAEALAAQFTIARGEGDRAALGLTKWFDSNYHYLVPEIGPETQFEFLGSQRLAGVEHYPHMRPVLVGPVTFLLLSRASESAPDDFHPLSRLDDVLGAYEDYIAALSSVGVSWIQCDEPALVSDRWSIPRKDILAAVKRAYQGLAATAKPRLVVALSYGHAADAVDVLAETPVAAVHIDTVRGRWPSAEEAQRWSQSWRDRTLVIGAVSGRNIWRADLSGIFNNLEHLKENLHEDVHLAVSTSTSLQHVPYDVSLETSLDPDIRSWLAFAHQKVEEVAILARGLNEGKAAIASQLEENQAILAARRAHPGVHRADIRQRTAAINEADRHRAPYPERLAAQEKALNLPPLPTTTIGSFPQTSEIRQARAAHRRGDLSTEDYKAAMRKEIHHVIRAQEEVGLDVLVHGEAERNDMVQYFAEHFDGFLTTTHGWVQSYGSRCTRPSILWGDVSRPAPVTVEWSGYAASLTDHVLKGMLTGPVTIMAWSFVREDIPWSEVADQLGLVLRDEIKDLEEAGVGVIQVDEPAIRELLPLRSSEEGEYLRWSVGAFRLATGGARPETSIHTHLCYSDFATVVDAIDRLDADVTSIEASRSKMAVLPAIAEQGFERQLGPGVWDIHSPRVPSVAEIGGLIRRATHALDPRQVWVNPDCGLKTRGWEETTATLKNLVEATRLARQASSTNSR